MILDRLDEAERYADLHPGFARAFAFLRSTDLLALAPGRYEIDGNELYVSIDHVDGRGREGARFEYHRAHIDIQLTLEGEEQIGWAPLASCAGAGEGFDPARDIGFCAEPPQTWLSLPPGTFAIFFPTDAHAPLAGAGPVKKAIVKVPA